VRRPLFARAACVMVLALAGCDVRLQPISGLDAAVAPPPNCPADILTGYASRPSAGFNGTTGGGTATPVVIDASRADALNQFKTAADRKTGAAAVIQIRGIIDFAGSSSSQIRVASNTTVVGMDNQSGFTGGGLNLNGSSNVIIKNLVISKAVGTDAISIQGPDATNIWVDHCDLSSVQHPDGASYDGLVDITHAADFITVSWTVFHDHRDPSIVGHSDSNAAEDTGKLHVTYHHDLFQRVQAGPRVRFGRVDVLNVFFDQVTYYAVASTMGAQVLVQNSNLQNVTAAGVDPTYYGPITTQLDSSAPGFVDLVNNARDAATVAPDVIAGQTGTFALEYDFASAFDSAGSVPVLVRACAGPRSVPGSF
jgi:pectate lyase